MDKKPKSTRGKSKAKAKEVVEPIQPKKRGRKPKGGKIITVTEESNTSNELATNVIVHLKCKKNDLDNGENFSTATSSSQTQPVSSANLMENNTYQPVSEKKVVLEKNVKSIHDKLRQLQCNLHNNTICETNSCCFWCTYEFSNLPIAIPKFEMNQTYHVYGCFCSPECAVAYLMNENLDSSTKFERYHLLCYIYGKVFDYKTNIKPAPNPHYTLKKFCGNLTIEEYREMFNSQNYLFIIDKPVTRELPELHEEFKNNNKFSYQSKNDIIVQTFST